MSGKILLTGASGYVGGTLLKRLELEGVEINCLARNPSKIQLHSPTTRVFKGDVRYPSTMWQAFRNVETAYYLIHSLSDKQKDFVKNELEAAGNFANMARAAGVKRIIYLGGLGREGDRLSPHLRSRQDVGYLLRNSGIQTIELRASIVLGAGSLSFEMIRSLTENLPAMVMPKWVSAKAQPIGIQDLLDYLVQSIDLKVSGSCVIEVGGADEVSYRDLMVEYARQRKLKRWFVPVPVLTPWLSSHWLGLVTPMQAAVGRKLIESIRNSTVVVDRSARDLFTIKPLSAADAIAHALNESKLETGTLLAEPELESIRLAS